MFSCSFVSTCSPSSSGWQARPSSDPSGHSLVPSQAQEPRIHFPMSHLSCETLSRKSVWRTLINHIAALDWIWPESISYGMVVTGSAVWGVPCIPGHRNTGALAIDLDFSFNVWQNVLLSFHNFNIVLKAILFLPTWVHWQSISSLASGHCSRPSHRCRPYMQEPSSHLNIQT